MGPVASAIGAVTGVVGGINGKNQQDAANASAGQDAAAMQQIAQQLQNNITNQTNQYNQNYSQALGPLTSGLMGEGGVSAGNASGLANALQQAGLDPSSLGALTGVNSLDPTQSAINYLSNPGATNLNGATGATNPFYTNEMQNGINPQYAQNAQNQIQQGLNSEVQNAMAHAQPGQNVNALVKDLNNQALTQHTNLAGNLAGQNQQIMQQGAQGLLGSAGNLDTQKAGMLQNAATGAQNFNQTAFGNLGASTASANSILQALQAFIGQGQGTVNSANSSLGGLMGSYGNQQANAMNAAGNAAQGAAGSFGSAANSLAGLFPMPSSSGTPSVDGNYSLSSSAPMPLGPAANGYAPYSGPTGSESSYTPLANAPTVNASAPLSYSQPQSGNFNSGMFTAPTMLSGQNYTA